MELGWLQSELDLRPPAQVARRSAGQQEETDGAHEGDTRGQQIAR